MFSPCSSVRENVGTCRAQEATADVKLVIRRVVPTLAHSTLDNAERRGRCLGGRIRQGRRVGMYMSRKLSRLRSPHKSRSRREKPCVAKQLKTEAPAGAPTPRPDLSSRPASPLATSTASYTPTRPCLCPRAAVPKKEAGTTCHNPRRRPARSLASTREPPQ